jgi:hypothetical protein
MLTGSIFEGFAIGETRFIKSTYRTSLRLRRNFRFWHLADIPAVAKFVCYWTKADKVDFVPGRFVR